MSGKTIIAPVVALTVITVAIFYFLPVQSAPASDDPLIYWVFDAARADSQFGYTRGGQSGTLGPVYAGHDIEGIACANGALYASSGGDGKTPSQLYKVVTDLGAGQADLQGVGVIATGSVPYYEVASLAERDGNLWGYAAEGEWQGILQINPTTAQATRIYTPSQAVDVSSMTWISDTLYLGARSKVYSWQPGTGILYLFATTLEQIEAMDDVDGLLNLAGDGVEQIQVYSPAGEYVGHRTAFVPLDIESLAFCGVAATPTPTETPSATATATQTQTPTATSTSLPTQIPGIASATLTAEATAVMPPTITPTPPATNTPIPPVAQVPLTPPPASSPTSTAPTADRVTAETRQFVIYIDVAGNGSQDASDFLAAVGTLCSAVRLDITDPVGGSTRMLFIGANGSLTINDLEPNAVYELDCARRLTYQFSTADVAGAVVTRLGMTPINAWAPVVSR